MTITKKQMDVIRKWCTQELEIHHIPRSVYPAHTTKVVPDFVKFFINIHGVCAAKAREKSFKIPLIFTDDAVKSSWNELERPLLEYVWNHLNKKQ